MTRLKILFTDFWSDFDPENNLFTKLLSSKYKVDVTANNPDLVFFSNFGYNHIYYNSKKLYFTGENLLPDYFDYDFAMGFHFDDLNPNYYRLPLYALYDDVSKLQFKSNPEEILSKKTKFCNFIYSNPINKERNTFFKKLNKYKRVEAAGRVLNNTGFLVKNKRDFLRNYKFTIAFENEISLGYTTEKIFEPMLSESMPIYWGNPVVDLDFNKDSFICANDFNNFNELVEGIIEIDNNDYLYLEKFKQPYFENNKINKYVNNENILNFLIKIVEYSENKKTFMYDKNNKLLNYYKNKLMMHYKLKNLRRILRFVTPQKPIMRFKTRNLKFK